MLTSLLPLTAAVRAEGDRPTIVLVHGAWAGPSCWNTVVQNLHDDGYRTVSPTLGLQSLQADVATGRFTGLIEQAVESTTGDQQSD